MAFGSKVFGRTYYGEVSGESIPQIPGFVTGYTVATSGAEASSRVTSGSSLTSVGASLSEIHDQQGGYPT